MLHAKNPIFQLLSLAELAGFSLSWPGTSKRFAILPRGYKTFPCSAQLSKKVQLHIKTKIPTNKEIFCFKYLRCCIYHADKCYTANNCCHLSTYEQDKFRAQLSWVWKKSITFGPGSLKLRQIMDALCVSECVRVYVLVCVCVCVCACVRACVCVCSGEAELEHSLPEPWRITFAICTHFQRHI